MSKCFQFDRGAGNLIIAEVVKLHIKESVLDAEGKIDAVKIVNKVLIEIIVLQAMPIQHAKGRRPSQFSIFFSSWRSQEESEMNKNQLNYTTNHCFVLLYSFSFW